MRPLFILEDPGLKEFIRYISQELGGVILEIHESTQVRADVARVAAELRASLKTIIRENCRYYCITIDIWLSIKTQSYMALMPHYVEEDFTLCSWTLEIELFPGVHTEAAIADDLDDMMERWGLDAELCTRMVRDGAANAVLASDFMQVTNMSCIAHSLHLVLSGALACQGKIQNEFQDAAGQREASVINETEFAQASEQEQLDLINAVEDFLDRTFAARETAPKVAMA